MTDFTGEVHGKSLLLRGWYERELEGAPESEALQRGDRGITVPLLIPPTASYNVVNVENSA
jgi:hypothetical protein